MGPTTESLLAAFAPIDLKEMDRVKLLVRMDTKYVFNEELLPEVLAPMLAEYRLLHVSGKLGTDYRTLYFDTPGLQDFRDHHNGRTFRSKVRFREYVGADLHFLEIKRKTGRGGTDKARTRVQGTPTMLSAEQCDFIDRSTGVPATRVPVLWNDFTRYTFVHRERAERLTMDVRLGFRTMDGVEATLGPVVVAELKQERGDGTSPFTTIMRSAGIRTSSLSKYCIGMLLTGKAPKYNTFKAVLLRIRSLHHKKAA